MIECLVNALERIYYEDIFDLTMKEIAGKALSEYRKSVEENSSVTMEAALKFYAHQKQCIACGFSPESALKALSNGDKK